MVAVAPALSSSGIDAGAVDAAGHGDESAASAGSTVVVAGVVIGNITASDEVRLLETGKVLGDITAPSISIQRGVVLKGNVEITGGQKKDARKLVEDSFGQDGSKPGVQGFEKKIEIKRP